VKVGTSQDIRRLDLSVITDYGVPQAVLMENAAIAARDVIQERWSIRNRDILVVCGSGNNAGDGFALARLLYARGAAVTVLLAGDTEKLKGASADNYHILRQLPLEIIILESYTHPPLLDRLNFSSYQLIVDALFGTGLSRKLDGRMAHLITRINASEVPVLSVDIPSGINADTGELMGTAIRAESTISFALPKRGNLLYPGCAMGGKLYLSEISFPPEAIEDEAILLSVNIPPPLPPRNPAGHKGNFGKILIIGGSSRYRGAPALAGGAALKSGAGYVRLAMPGELVPQVVYMLSEAVFLPQGEGSSIGVEQLSELLEQAVNADAVVIGPGLSTEPESIQFAREFIALAEASLVIDGDALSALAGREELTRERKYPTCITPHSGEMARLLGSSVSEIETRRIETAQEAADRYGVALVLKGAHSIIAGPDGSLWINLTGNSGMGTAGSGDVLAGLSGALLGRFHHDSPATEALRLAVHLHGLAGDLASAKHGEEGITATDILRHLPRAIAEYQMRIESDPFSGRITRI